MSYSAHMRLFGKKRTYLDWAAAAPVKPEAARAFTRALRAFGNPSSPHEEGRAGRVILEEVRTAIARILGVKADDVIFTSGATEANNIALMGHVDALIEAGRKPEDIHILYLPTSHASVIETIAALHKRGVVVEALPLGKEMETIEYVKLAEMIRPETALVSMDFVCGETGIVWPVREMRHFLDEVRGTGDSKILLHADATQAPLAESIDRSRIGADLITLDASKVGGVRGIGVLVAHRTIPLASLIHGGGQERSLRSGTQSPALAAAFAAALTVCEKERAAFSARAAAARASLIETVRAFAPPAYIQEGKRQVSNILNISFPGIDTDYLAAVLDEAGFAVSTRSACETDAEGSRAVYALTNDAERAKATLRVSWGPTTPTQAVSRFGTALCTALTFVDSARA